MSHDHGGYGVSSETFHQIIQERKATLKKETKLRVKTDLEYISKAQHPLSIVPSKVFPEEMWHKILSEIDDPNDLNNVLLSHGFFLDLKGNSMSKEETSLLRILSIKMPPICSDHKSKCNCLISKENRRRPLGSYLPLRGISKSIRDGIDRWYETNLLRIMREGKNDFLLKVPSVVFSSRDQSINRMLKNFDGNGGLRIISRAVQLHLYSFDCNDEDDFHEDENVEFRDFKESFLKVLKNIGDQIWYFQYCFDDFDEATYVELKEIYVFLQECFEHMPNLRWFEIDVCEYMVSSWRRPIILKVTDEFETHPIPNLKHLERLSIKIRPEDDLPEMYQIFEAILLANPQVKIVTINGNYLPALPQKESLQQHLPQLSSFSIGGDGSSYLLKDILPMINFNWNLKRVQLGAWSRKNSIHSVFEFLENFPTLENVSLFLEDVTIREHEDVPFLKLPNLQHFQCELLNPKFDPSARRNGNFFFLYSLQFLLHCEKLKTISWKNDMFAENYRKLRRYMKNRERHENGVNFRGGFRDLKYSNVWDVFPRLEWVEAAYKDFEDEWDTRIHRRSHKGLGRSKKVYLLT